MKLIKRLSPKQKSIFQRSPEILFAMFLLGTFSTQINTNKNLGESDRFELEHVKSRDEQQEENLLESASIEPAAVEAFSTKNTGALDQVATKNSATSTKAVAGTQKALATRSAATYSQMKMELNNYSGKLSWANTFQRNVKAFVIERSVDDEQYTAIGQVKGKGKGEFTAKNIYEFEDTSLLFVQMPSVLYRIKQVGVHGDKDYSEVIEYDLGLPEGLYARIQITPKEELHIQYSATTSGPIRYQILNALGSPVGQGTVQGEYDPQSLFLSIDNWEKGAYYLKLNSEKHSYMEAFEL